MVVRAVLGDQERAGATGPVGPGVREGGDPGGVVRGGGPEGVRHDGGGPAPGPAGAGGGGDVWPGWQVFIRDGAGREDAGGSWICG